MITVPSNSTNLKTDTSELPPLPWGHTHNHIHLTSTENSCPQTSWALHFLTAETGEVTQVYFTLALFVVVGHLHLLGKLTTSSDSPALHPSVSAGLLPTPAMGSCALPVHSLPAISFPLALRSSLMSGYFLLCFTVGRVRFLLIRIRDHTGYA